MKYMLLYRWVFAAIILTACNGTTDSSRQGNAKQPNILFIFSDDHTNNAIGAYGNALAKTPNIDRIAAEGALFRNFFVTNSICGPSRASLLTGKYSHANGFMSNEQRFNIDQFVFSRLLQETGYQTAWIGKWHLGTLPGDAFDYWNILPGQGFYFNPDFINNNNDTIRHEGYVTDIITQLASGWLDQRDKDKPFFMVVGEKATHREWLPDIQDLGTYDSVEFPLPETFYDDYRTRQAAANQDMTIDETMRLDIDLKVNLDFEKTLIYSRMNADQKAAYKTYYTDRVSKEFNDKQLSGKALTAWKFQRYMRDYLATANSLDRNIGRLLDYLKAHGLAENTIVIYGSDQGFYLGEHGWFDKRFIYEQSLRTPFVMRYPGVVAAGTSIDQFVLNIDLAPTLLELAGAAVPKEIQGQSFLPILRDGNTAGRDAVYYHYYEYPEPHRVMPHFGVRTKQYKLVRFYGEKNFWELFDLENDPNELTNLYGSDKYEATIMELKEKLKELITQYEDTDAARILAEETAR
ncbi:sulfatase family protein [Parapedobacter lycopersici]|uniref:sulfatase family protein n=1 Tax=Parapedobacter lycopersici TaxID=1864939 RepID=UPI00214DE0C5|nr:sulfatase [Parapedobacter lycopersici]